MVFHSYLSPHEIEVYSVHLVPNTPYHAVVQGEQHEYRLADPSLTIRDPATGTIIAAGDNTPLGGLDPVVLFTVPAEADYHFEVRDLTGDMGSYQAGILNPQGQVLDGTFVGTSKFDPATGMTVPFENETPVNTDPGPFARSPFVPVMGIPDTAVPSPELSPLA